MKAANAPANGGNPGAPNAPQAAPGSLTPDGNPFLGAQDAQRFVGAPSESDVARASLLQMNEISRRAESAGMSFTLGGPPPPMPPAVHANPSAAPLADADAGVDVRSPAARQAHARDRAEALERMQELQRRAEQAAASTSAAAAALGGGGAGGVDDAAGAEPFLMPSGAEQEGLQVFTVGSLLPRSQVDDPNGNWTFDMGALGAGGFVQVAEPGGAEPSQAEAGGELLRPPSKLRVRRSTFVPGWAVPPRVLLVDDDAVTRKLSSKFLQVFGCTTDVAVDGVSAVNKMNLEKYDLVLMVRRARLGGGERAADATFLQDIVMPKLDGVSATSLIRQFDHMTPIISMTSASKPNEIMTYYSSGMNDILPKPFSKEGLLEMLEVRPRSLISRLAPPLTDPAQKHLMHLKVFQQMNGKIPRPLTPAANSFEALALPTTNPADALAAAAAAGDPSGGGKINPLQAFGMTEEQYAALLQTMVSEDASFGAAVRVDKRALEMDDDGAMREGKRGRFEEVA
jgi:osomolarity two-component system, response regulator SKN7